MSDKPYLIISHDGYRVRLAWFFPAEEDEGAWLGDEGPPTDPQERAEQVVSYEAAEAAGGTRDHRGFYWDTESAAKKAKTAVGAAIKLAEKNRPMPDWATKALAAGWKAPKGWRP